MSINNNVFPGWSLLNPVFRRRCKYAPGWPLLTLYCTVINKQVSQANFRTKSRTKIVVIATMSALRASHIKPRLHQHTCFSVDSWE